MPVSNGPGKESSLSVAYRLMAMPSCLRLLTQLIRIALALAEERAGNNKAASAAMIAMTTSSSIKVNAKRLGLGRVISNRHRGLEKSALNRRTDYSFLTGRLC